MSMRSWEGCVGWAHCCASVGRSWEGWVAPTWGGSRRGSWQNFFYQKLAAKKTELKERLDDRESTHQREISENTAPAKPRDIISRYYHVIISQDIIEKAGHNQQVSTIHQLSQLATNAFVGRREKKLPDSQNMFPTKNLITPLGVNMWAHYTHKEWVNPCVPRRTLIF